MRSRPMTTKKTFEERARELAESFGIEVEIRAMVGATKSITPRDILVDLITQALQETHDAALAGLNAHERSFLKVSIENRKLRAALERIDDLGPFCEYPDRCFGDCDGCMAGRIASQALKETE